MKIILNEPLLAEQPSVKLLISYLEENEKKLKLIDSTVYHNLLFSEESEKNIRRSDITIISRNHGILLFRCLDKNTIGNEISEELLRDFINDFEQIYSLMFAKLLKFPELRDNPTKLKVNISPILFITDFEIDTFYHKDQWIQLEIGKGLATLEEILKKKLLDKSINDELFNMFESVLEGSYILRKKKIKDVHIGVRSVQNAKMKVKNVNIPL